MLKHRRTNQFLKLCATIWILSSNWNRITVRCDEIDDVQATTELPKFLTKGGTFRAVIGDTVLLPCQVDNLGRYILVWKRGNAVLSAGDLKVTVDPRIHLVDGYNLEIKKVRIHDAGDYICQMSTLQPEDQIYTLEILVPPSIRTEPTEGLVTLTKGDTVTLQCKSTGNPVPTITWTRRNNVLPNGEESAEGNTFSIQNADRHQIGVYICSASNGVGTPVSASIHVKVHYSPEMEVERSWIHSADGYETEMACIVHAEPPATVKWYHESMLIEPNDRIFFDERGTKHSLIIRLVEPIDFGNFTCIADNKFGKAQKSMRLSGKPHRPVITSDPVGQFHDSFNLTWSVESLSPVSEYRVFYRNTNSFENLVDHQKVNVTQVKSKDWNEIVIPVTSDSSNRIHQHNGNSVITSTSDLVQISGLHQKAFLIKHLEPETFYDVQISVLNKYGISKLSEVFSFSTSKRDTSSLESSQKQISTDPEEIKDSFNLILPPSSIAIRIHRSSFYVLIFLFHLF